MEYSVKDGHYISESDSILIDADMSWHSLTIDPLRSRRFDWSTDIVRCATGLVRIDGMCRVTKLSDELSVNIVVCTDQQCLPGENVRLYIVQ